MPSLRLFGLVPPCAAPAFVSLVLAGCSGGGDGSGGDGGIGADSAYEAAARLDIAGGGDSRSDTTAANTCPGAIIASWKADGVPFVASTSLYLGLEQTWQLTLVECVDDGVDRTVQFSSIPGPIAVGSYTLSFKALHGMAANGMGGAIYQAKASSSIGADSNYYTDATHTGTLAVTAVDMAAKKFSATFSFTGVNDAGTGTAQIADGVITNAPFGM